MCIHIYIYIYIYISASWSSADSLEISTRLFAPRCSAAFFMFILRLCCVYTVIVMHWYTYVLISVMFSFRAAPRPSATCVVYCYVDVCSSCIHIYIYVLSNVLLCLFNNVYTTNTYVSVCFPMPSATAA